MLSDPNLIAEFVVESLEHLEAIEPLLLELEKRGAADDASLNEVFRAIHSIKGAAGFLGLENVCSLSHAGESLLMKLRDGQCPFRAEMAEPLLRAVDALRTLLRGLPESQGERASELIAKLEALLEPATDVHAVGAESEGFAGDCEAQRSKGHHLVRIALPARKRERTKLVAKLERYGELVPEPTGDGKSVVVGSPLEPDLLAEAIELDPSLLEPVGASAPVGAQEFGLPDSTRPLAFYTGQIAVDLGFITDENRREILRAQQRSLLRRSFGETAIELGLLSASGVETIVSTQARLLAEAGLEALPSEDAELESDAATDAKGAIGRGPRNDATGTLEKRADTIRVSLARLDKLMNLAGELVLARNQMRQLLEASKHAGVKEVLQSLDLVTSELQENIMNTRMQPIRVLFDRMPRLVRDLAQKLGKKVELEIGGADVELDRSIIEALADPMTHMLRNALDHGLEDPQGRAVLGKPETGRVWVRAFHECGRVMIEVRDDGRGIDPERVKDFAIARGAISEEQGATISEKDAISLIFEPGLSTAPEISNLSGRGVGMDVVRTNISNLGGQIDVVTAIGEGTTLRVHLPLTLAIIPSLIVSVAGERFAVPQVNVVEVVRLKSEAQQIERIRSTEVLRLRGELLPLVRLADCLEIPMSEGVKRPRSNVVVVRSGSHLFGLVVDELHDHEEIVVKPVSSHLADCGWYAGATILGDGRVAMILDTIGIARRSGTRFEQVVEASKRGSRAGSAPETPGAERRSLVLFANTADERFAVPLSDLLRLERVDKTQVEWIGDKPFLNHRGRAIPLVNLEDVLPVGGNSGDSDEFFVLIPRIDGYEAGIIASRIVDTLESDAQPESAQIHARGLLGSAIVDDRLTLFLDARQLLEAAGIERMGV